MKRTAIIGIIWSLSTSLSIQAQSGHNLPFQTTKSCHIVDSIYDRMSVEERVAQLHGVTPGMLVDKNGKLSDEKCRKNIPFGIGHVCQFACAQESTPDKLRDFVADLQKWLRENTPAGIPAICHEEAISGFAAKGATVYPQQLGVACSWDIDLMEKKSGQTAKAMRKVGSTMALSPMVDVIRTPTFNRIEEGYGEDSYLSGAMGTAFVKGLQGADLSKGVAACSKHFLGYGGGSESEDKELTEEILFPHEAMIRFADSKCVMTGYHSFKGIPVVGNEEIINDYLRQRTGFDGIVVSDYGAIPRLVRGDSSLFLSGIKAINAGNDLEFSYGKSYPLLPEALRKGFVSEKRFEEAVKRALTLKLRLGILEPDAKLYESGHLNLDEPEWRQTAYDMAVESIVLLKNNGTLPLKGNKKIALVGPNANSFWSLVGDYAYPSMLAFWRRKNPDPTNPMLITIYEGLKDRLPKEMELSYERGVEWAKPGEATVKSSGDVDPRTSNLTNMMISSADPTDYDTALQIANESDVILACMGENPALCGEARVRQGINLPGDQEKFVSDLIATGKPVVLILMGGRPLVIDNIADRCAAIMHAWFPGEEGGNAVADILLGNISPSGKLCISYPKVEKAENYCYNYSIEPSEDIAYPFGHGLSYTTFAYDGLKLDKKEVNTDDEAIEFSVDITNTGENAGDEIIQIYITPIENQNLKPIQLKGFTRISLKVGESKQLKGKLMLSQLAYYFNRQWHIAPGEYILKVGASSTDIRQQANFKVKGQTSSMSFRPHLFAEFE